MSITPIRFAPPVAWFAIFEVFDATPIALRTAFYKELQLQSYIRVAQAGGIQNHPVRCAVIPKHATRHGGVPSSLFGVQLHIVGPRRRSGFLNVKLLCKRGRRLLIVHRLNQVVHALSFVSRAANGKISMLPLFLHGLWGSLYPRPLLANTGWGVGLDQRLAPAYCRNYQTPTQDHSRSFHHTITIAAGTPPVAPLPPLDICNISSQQPPFPSMW